MFCRNCQTKMRSNYRHCPRCGVKQNQLSLIVFGIMTSIGLTLLSAYFLFPKEGNLAMFIQHPHIEEINHIDKNSILSQEIDKKIDNAYKPTINVTDLISQVQPSVYTIFSSSSQGSGFLYNSKGIVITNAHVVEGDLNIIVKTNSRDEFPGTVIGYSNETDIAVISVPQISDIEPFPIEKQQPVQTGEKIIALGSPEGLENTASTGFITGTGRNFVIGRFIYENLYQISAPISQGSSGGPLVSQNSEKIIAINSAKSLEDSKVGFSIPIYLIVNLVDSWIENPMSEQDILAQFYNSDGDYFFSNLWEEQEGYFDAGEYKEDPSIIEDANLSTPIDENVKEDKPIIPDQPANVTIEGNE